jgi:putative copper export protein
VRLFLHVLGASVWVGGQLTLAGLVPGLRRASPEAPRFAARRFDLVAWPAYALLWLTGMWNLMEITIRCPSEYATTLMVKVVVVVVSGLTAFLHAQSTSRRALAIFGAFTGLSALVAMFLGVLLASG